MFISQSDSGFLIHPGKAKNITFDFGKKQYPVRQTIRVTGFGVFPEPFSGRGEGVFRNFAFHIDDYLDSAITYHEKYSLVFMGNGKKLERNAFYRLSEDELKPFADRIKVISDEILQIPSIKALEEDINARTGGMVGKLYKIDLENNRW